MISNFARLCLSYTATSIKSRSYHSLITVKKNMTRKMKYPISRYVCTSITKKSNRENPIESMNSPETDEFDNEESPYKEIDFVAIADNDEKKMKQLKLIQLEIDMMRQQGEKVPSSLKTYHWKEFLKYDSVRDRMKYYNYLWVNEHKNRQMKLKKKEKFQEYLENKASEFGKERVFKTNTPPHYGLQYNTLFHRIYDMHMNTFYNLRLLYAMMYNHHIIVDMAYEPFMTNRNLNHCVKQIMLTWAENRSHLNPFHLIFCNLDQDSVTYEKILRQIPTISDPCFPFFTNSKHYLELYPKEKLVYLTPHCSEELVRYNHDDIYIIGGYVDMHRCEPLSLAKAKKEGLRMAKFPLDRYLKWQVGHKSLTINQSLSIMNDLKETNDWKIAFKHVPSRKIRPPVFDEGEDGEFTGGLVPQISAKNLRDQYRRNLVYDLLMKDKFEKPENNSK